MLPSLAQYVLSGPYAIKIQPTNQPDATENSYLYGINLMLYSMKNIYFHLFKKESRESVEQFRMNLIIRLENLFLGKAF